MLVARSFDVNLPGKDIDKLVGCVLGGALKQGSFKKGDKVVILPGERTKNKDKVGWNPIHTEIKSLNYGNDFVEQATPGGNFGMGTNIDPFYGKGDKLAGNIVCLRDKPIEVLDSLDLEVHLLDKMVGASEEASIEKIKTGESLLISAWTSRTLGVVNSISDNKAEVSLRTPLAILRGERVALSRRINNKWRLIGWSIIL
jgi:translation initiation factor 2 subunit 3